MNSKEITARIGQISDQLREIELKGQKIITNQDLFEAGRNLFKFYQDISTNRPQTIIMRDGTTLALIGEEHSPILEIELPGTAGREKVTLHKTRGRNRFSGVLATDEDHTPLPLTSRHRKQLVVAFRTSNQLSLSPYLRDYFDRL